MLDGLVSAWFAGSAAHSANEVNEGFLNAKQTLSGTYLSDELKSLLLLIAGDGKLVLEWKGLG